MGLYKRGNVWWMSYVVDGRQHCESTGTSNRRLARKILDTRRAEIVEGRYANLIKSHTPRLKDWLKRYIEAKTYLNPNTRKRYECSQRNLEAFFGDCGLQDITAARIEEYKRAKLESGMRGAGVNRNLAFLRLALRQAKRERFIGQNPLEGPDLFMDERKDRLQAKVLSLEEERKLLSVSSGYLRVLILLLVDTGLRVGREALPLRWSDVDLEEGVLYVRASKTRAGIRAVPLTVRLKAELRRWMHIAGPRASQFVFSYPRDPLKHLQAVRKTWARALKDAGVERRRIYDLRATFASRLNAAGVQQPFIRQLLGHADGLAETYAKATDEFRRAAIEKLEAYVSPKVLATSTTTQSTENRWVN